MQFRIRRTDIYEWDKDNIMAFNIYILIGCIIAAAVVGYFGGHFLLWLQNKRIRKAVQRDEKKVYESMHDHLEFEIKKMEQKGVNNGNGNTKSRFRGSSAAKGSADKIADREIIGGQGQVSNGSDTAKPRANIDLQWH